MAKKPAAIGQDFDPQPLPNESVEFLTSCLMALYGPASSCQSTSKQSLWDRPGLLANSVVVEGTQISAFQWASLLTAHALHTGNSIHTGNWLLALPVTVCVLWLEYKAVHITVGLTLAAVAVQLSTLVLMA